MTEFLRKNKLAVAGLIIVTALTLTAVFAPWFIPYDLADQDLVDRLQGPSWRYPFCNDVLRCDILSRIGRIPPENFHPPYFAEYYSAGFGSGQHRNGRRDSC